MKHGNLWSPLGPLLREIDMCAYGVFCRKFNSQQFLFEAFFDIFDIFGSVQPKANLPSPFLCIITFQNGNLWSLLAPVQGGEERSIRESTKLFVENDPETSFIFCGIYEENNARKSECWFCMVFYTILWYVTTLPGGDVMN